MASRSIPFMLSFAVARAMKVTGPASVLAAAAKCAGGRSGRSGVGLVTSVATRESALASTVSTPVAMTGVATPFSIRMPAG